MFTHSVAFTRSYHNLIHILGVLETSGNARFVSFPLVVGYVVTCYNSGDTDWRRERRSDHCRFCRFRGLRLTMTTSTLRFVRVGVIGLLRVPASFGGVEARREGSNSNSSSGGESSSESSSALLWEGAWY